MVQECWSALQERAYIVDVVDDGTNNTSAIPPEVAETYSIYNGTTNLVQTVTNIVGNTTNIYTFTNSYDTYITETRTNQILYGAWTATNGNEATPHLTGEFVLSMYETAESWKDYFCDTLTGPDEWHDTFNVQSSSTPETNLYPAECQTASDGLTNEQWETSYVTRSEPLYSNRVEWFEAAGVGLAEYPNGTSDIVSGWTIIPERGHRWVLADIWYSPGSSTSIVYRDTPDPTLWPDSMLSNADSANRNGACLICLYPNSNIGTNTGGDIDVVGTFAYNALGTLSVSGEVHYGHDVDTLAGGSFSLYMESDVPGRDCDEIGERVLAISNLVFTSVSAADSSYTNVRMTVEYNPTNQYAVYGEMWEDSSWSLGYPASTIYPAGAAWKPNSILKVHLSQLKDAINELHITEDVGGWGTDGEQYAATQPSVATNWSEALSSLDETNTTGAAGAPRELSFGWECDNDYWAKKIAIQNRMALSLDHSSIPFEGTAYGFARSVPPSILGAWVAGYHEPWFSGGPTVSGDWEFEGSSATTGGVWTGPSLGSASDPGDPSNPSGVDAYSIQDVSEKSWRTDALGWQLLGTHVIIDWTIGLNYIE